MTQMALPSGSTPGDRLSCPWVQIRPWGSPSDTADDRLGRYQRDRGAAEETPRYPGRDRCKRSITRGRRGLRARLRPCGSFDLPSFRTPQTPANWSSCFKPVCSNGVPGQARSRHGVFWPGVILGGGVDDGIAHRLDAWPESNGRRLSTSLRRAPHGTCRQLGQSARYVVSFVGDSAGGGVSSEWKP